LELDHDFDLGVDFAELDGVLNQVVEGVFVKLVISAHFELGDWLGPHHLHLLIGIDQVFCFVANYHNDAFAAELHPEGNQQVLNVLNQRPLRMNFGSRFVSFVAHCLQVQLRKNHLLHLLGRPPNDLLMLVVFAV